MHMVHINTKYIGEDGDLDDGYTENDDGAAVLGFVFEVVDGAEVDIKDISMKIGNYT